MKLFNVHWIKNLNVIVELFTKSVRLNQGATVLWSLSTWRPSSYTQPERCSSSLLGYILVSVTAAGWDSSPLSFRDCCLQFNLVKSSYKKHHLPTASCCLHDGRQPLQSQCFCSPGEDLCPADWWTQSRTAARGPGWPACCCMSECGGCTDAEGCQRSRHPAGTETRSGSVLLRKDDKTESASGRHWMMMWTVTPVALQ